MSNEPSPQPSTARAKKRLRPLRGLAVLAVTTALLLGGAELSLRYLLFADDPIPAQLAARLRKPKRYASAYSESLYWKLSYIWADHSKRGSSGPGAHPLLGWRSGRVTPELNHKQLQLVGEQRPVLLYGDSFAHCLTEEEESFHPLFEETPLGPTHELLNFGVGGFGLGQIHLLFRATIDDLADRDPLVVFSFLQDGDINRTTLDFRSWPKPRLYPPRDPAEGLLMQLPGALDAETFLAEHPPSTPSYLWRLLLHGSGLLPERWSARLRGDAEFRELKQRITRAILEDLKAQLDARDLDGFVLLFQQEWTAREMAPTSWEEPFLMETLRELEIPYVTTRPDLQTAALRRGVDLKEFYLGPGKKGAGHMNVEGNRVAVGTILRGMDRRFDPYEFTTGTRAGRR